MSSSQFVKVNIRTRQKKSLSEVQWPLLKFLMRKQQIQQMSCLSQDNGLMIYFKLKHLLFPDIQEDDQVVNIVREDPIKSIGKVLLTITQYYNQKLTEIVQPLEQEKSNLSNRLKQTKEKLQHSMDDNEHFKTIIDRLQQQKKDIQCLLNQSQDDIERSYQDFQNIVGQKEKIKSEVSGIYESYQSILAQNSQLKDINLENQKELFLIKHKYNKLLEHSQKTELLNKSLEEQKMLLQQQNCRLRDQNQTILAKINQKEEFIASFISQYNKIHYFQRQQDSYNDADKVAVDTSKDSDFNELKGFNFNGFDKDSINSEKSSRKSSVKISSKSKSNQIDCDFDQKFLYVNATAEKLKVPLPNKITGSQNKNQGQSNLGGQQLIKIIENEKNSTAKQIFQTKRQLKALAKAESSKTLRNRQSNITPSDGEGSKMNIQQVLRKKLLEKNAKIGRLQFELNSLRSLYIEERENITEMQGNYQIQIDELKQELKYLKKEFNTLYQKYVLADSYYQIYQEKVIELQNQLVRIEQEHQFYCEQLKRRCKLYIIKKLDQAELHYQTIRSAQYSTQKREHPESEYIQVRNIQKFCTQQPQIEEAQEEGSRQTLSLKLHDANQESLSLKHEEQSSDIYSYEHIQNHYVNGFGLDLEFSLTNKNNDNEQQLQEIYIRQNFQIQSDLGGFTQRMMSNKLQSSKHKGNLTDRVPAKMLKSMIEIKVRSKFCIQSSLFNIKVSPVIKNNSLYSLYDFTVFPHLKSLQISRSIHQKVIPLKKKFGLVSQSCNYSYFAQKNIHLSSELLSINISPFKRNEKFTYCKLVPVTMNGLKKKQISLNTNILSFVKENNKKNNKISKFVSIYNNSIKIQEVSLSKKSVQTQTYQYQGSFKIKRSNKGKLILAKFSSLQVCVKSNKQQIYSFPDCISNRQCVDLAESIVDLPTSHNQQQKTSYPKDLGYEQEQKQLFVSRLDDYNVREIDEKPNYKLNSTQKHEHSRVNSIPSFQNVREIRFSKSNMSQINIEKGEHFEQLSRVIQKTKASTVQTYGQWYQVDKAYKNIEKQSQQQHLQYKLPQIDEALHCQQRIQNSLNSLNKAIVLSNKHNDKADSQKSRSSFNPESKHNRAVTQIQDCHITPWFIDEKKHLIVDNQIISIENMPAELVKEMDPESLWKLAKFLKQNRITLKFLQLVQAKNFKKPTNLTKKMLILRGRSNHIEKTFLLASRFVYCLEDKTKICLSKAQILINGTNFCLGQSQVVISGDGKLIINRKNKHYRLDGNIQDGVWQISSFMACEYKSTSNK